MMSDDTPDSAGIAAQLKQIIDTQATTRDEVNRKLELINADTSMITNEVEGVKKRIGSVEEWRAAQEDRLARTSLRVHGLDAKTSEHDLTHDAKMADEIIARRALEAKVDALAVATDNQTRILTRIEKLASNPIVKQVATAIGAAILTYLASKGIR